MPWSSWHATQVSYHSQDAMPALTVCLCLRQRNEEWERLQEVWEAQAAVVERSSKQAASSAPDEQTAEGGGSSQQHSVYHAQIERLTAADVVLVPYGVLSQEVRSRCTQSTLLCTVIICLHDVAPPGLKRHAEEISDFIRLDMLIAYQ